MGLNKRIANLEKAKHPILEGERLQWLANQTPEGMEALRLGEIAYQNLRQSGRLPDDPMLAMMTVATETEEGRQSAELGAAAIAKVMNIERGGSTA